MPLAPDASELRPIAVAFVALAMAPRPMAIVLLFDEAAS